MSLLRLEVWGIETPPEAARRGHPWSKHRFGSNPPAERVFGLAFLAKAPFSRSLKAWRGISSMDFGWILVPTEAGSASWRTVARLEMLQLDPLTSNSLAYYVFLF